jgi:NitT/TauT family transport system substrate-binding protein
MKMLTSALRGMAAAAAVAGLCAGGAHADPLKIRMAWVVTPASIVPLIAKVPAGVTTHLGKSYTIEDTHIGASSQQITALAAGQIDIAGLNYSSLPLAVINGGLEDVRIVADEIQDGHPGYYSVGYWVRKDSGIKRIEELKGKTLAVNGHGTGVEMALTIVMQKHGMNLTDAQVVEVPFANMAATLADKKVDLAEPPAAFTDAKFEAMATPLFHASDAFGVSTLSFWVARQGFIQKNRAALVDLIEDYIRVIRWFNDPKNNAAAIGVASAFTKIPAAKFEGWAFGKGDFYRDPNAMVDIKALQSNMAAAAKLKVIPREIDAEKYADLSLARDAAARIK